MQRFDRCELWQILQDLKGNEGRLHSWAGSVIGASGAQTKRPELRLHNVDRRQLSQLIGTCTDKWSYLGIESVASSSS